MSLLSALPTKGIITQNYDKLVEKAVACVNIASRRKKMRSGGGAAELSCLPYRPIKGAGNWLLKMHGCVSRVEDIVITSKDFESFENGKRT
jgi:hypothetical protein